jgi:hypothetical protein
MNAPILLALAALSTAQAAEPTGMLALACEGTLTITDMKTKDAIRKPISTSIIVDFERRIVEFERNPVPISRVTETAIEFHLGTYLDGVALTGTIDRVTGMVEAQTISTSLTGNLQSNSSLKCKPTQRMF